jgi:hypothetical protein
MEAAMPRLTKRLVEGASLQAKPYFLWDDELRGFGARILPSGQRNYYVDYRNKSGARKRMKIGAHGPLTCEEARLEAKGALGEAVRGSDPATERQTRRQSMKVTQLCDKYMADVERGLIRGKGGRPKKLSTATSDRGRIERHIKPLLGSRLVLDLRAPDICRFH